MIEVVAVSGNTELDATVKKTMRAVSAAAIGLPIRRCGGLPYSMSSAP